MMPVLKRRKRADVGTIYRTCKQWGTCPDDVVNKVEQNTLADKILKYGSTAVFFGGLGIGTGKYGGGRVPGVTIGGAGASARPIPVDPELIGPAEIIPIDAEGPAVVEGVDPAEIPATTRPSRPVRPGRVRPIRPKIPVTDAVVPSPDIIATETSTTYGFNRVTLTPIQQLERAITIYHQYVNPSFEVSLTSDIASAEASLQDSVLVGEGLQGNIVGATEEIPLEVFPQERNVIVHSEPSGTDIQETSFIDTTEEEISGFLTSTPERPPRTTFGRSRARNIVEEDIVAPGGTDVFLNQYGPRTEQVEILGDTFLGAPETLVEYRNPLYNTEDVSLIFQRDIARVEAAPMEEFSNIVRLSRPMYSRLQNTGRLRVSRLGQRANIQTRSGLRIGPQAHFYQDISSILEPEGIEMQVLGEQSGDATIVQAQAETVLISDSSESTVIGRNESSFNPIQDTTYQLSTTTPATTRTSLFSELFPEPSENTPLFPDMEIIEDNENPLIFLGGDDEARTLPISTLQIHFPSGGVTVGDKFYVAPKTDIVNPSTPPVVIIDPITGEVYSAEPCDLYPALCKKRKRQLSI